VPWSFVLLGITSYRTRIFISLHWQKKRRQFTSSDISTVCDLTPMLGRVKEAPILLMTCLIECFLRRHQLLRIKTD